MQRRVSSRHQRFSPLAPRTTGPFVYSSFAVRARSSLNGCTCGKPPSRSVMSADQFAIRHAAIAKHILFLCPFFFAPRSFAERVHLQLQTAVALGPVRGPVCHQARGNCKACPFSFSFPFSRHLCDRRGWRRSGAWLPVSHRTRLKKLNRVSATTWPSTIRRTRVARVVLVSLSGGWFARAWLNASRSAARREQIQC